MSKISKLCSLTTKYTNHSIRAAGATLLSRCMFNPAQIMAVTGHKSVSSLAVYQRISDSEKVAMGKAIGSSIDNNSNVMSKTPIPNNIAGGYKNFNIETLELERDSNSTFFGGLPPNFNCRINNFTINVNKN